MFKLTIQQIGLNGYAAEAISSANNIHMFQKVLRFSQVSAPVPTSRFSEFEPSAMPQLTSLSVTPSPVQTPSPDLQAIDIICTRDSN